MTTTARAVVPTPENEPVKMYAPGSPERASIEAELRRMSGDVMEGASVIGGQRVTTGDLFEVRAPHNTELLLGKYHAAGREHVTQAIDAALEAKHDWEALDWEARAAIFLRAADLLAGPWRDRINASTMLGQSKTVYQAEIDAAAELVDFFKFNVDYYSQILDEQPISAPGIWDRLDHRPLEGFVLAITPFNFTSIAANLPAAPALCGNTVVWKPSEKQAHSAQLLMELFEAAGLPDGVINLVHGDGATISDVCFDHHEFSGLHFTGSTAVFQSMWKRIGSSLPKYRTYPRIVGETGGKDFLIAHPSSLSEAVDVAMVRGAFEYQGQKCSALSRAYVPRSLWDGGLRDAVIERTDSLTMGDVTDFSNFMGAVIEERSFIRHRDAIAAARGSAYAQVIAGGHTDDSVGWFVEPTVIEVSDPQYDTMERELFGPVLSVFVYDDNEWDATLDVVDSTSPYALTGAVFGQDRYAVEQATGRLRHAAGNFYINDKPTGAVVGQQPFGGGRASGTNDKAGSSLNLLRWISPRAIKENFVPPTDHTYPHMG